MNTRTNCLLIVATLMLVACGLGAQAGWSVQSGFIARESHASVVFNGRMWVIGGLANNLNRNDVWSSANGADWVLELESAPWSPRADHAAVVYNGRIWLTGGGDSWNAVNDVWSSADGVNWTQETGSAAWSARSGHTLSAFNGKMWLLGGISGGGYFMGSVYNEAWSSSDGINWTQEATPAWPARYGHAAEVLGGELFVMGGSEGLYFLNDVWAYDGSTWTLKTSNAWTGFSGPNPLAYFGPRHGASVFVLNNQLWAIAGEAGLGPYATLKAMTDVWASSDGITWNVITTGFGWAPRVGHTTLAFNNTMWIIGGCANGWSQGIFGTARVGEHVNDVWSSTDGMIWSEATGTGGFDGWQGRAGHSSTVLNNKLWVMGGLVPTPSGDVQPAGDVWSSANGVQWTEETASAGWSGRSCHASVAFNNQLWVLGGLSATGAPLNDIWFSADGANWTPAAAGGTRWSARRSHAALVLNGRMWVLGGVSGAIHHNDVWSSADGVSWTQATPAAPWAGRRELSAVAFNNRMWVMGGFDGTNYMHDVWSSADGINWTLETAGALWSKRYGQACTVAEGRIWLAGGKALPAGLWLVCNYPATSVDFEAAAGTPSGEQTFAVGGVNMNTPLVVTPPAGFEVALCGGAFQSAALSIAPTAGVLPPTTVRMRYNPASGAAHSGTLLVSTVGAERMLALSGTVAPSGSPVISLTGGLAPFVGATGAPSPEQTYIVQASGLTDNLVITAPASFEIALAGDAFTSSISLAPAAGSVNPTTIRVRYLRSGNGYAGASISHASTGAANQTTCVSSAESYATTWPGDMRDLWSSADGINWVPEGNAPWSVRLEHTLEAFDGGLWMLGGGHFGYSGVTYNQMIPLGAEAWRFALPELRLGAASYSISEGAGAAVVSVTLTRAFGFDVQVDYATSDGTATQPLDYLAGTGTVTIPAGQTSVDISIVIIDDSLDEPDETLQISLSTPQYAGLGTPASATVNILDDDGAPTVRFAAAAYAVGEAAGTLDIEIELSNVSGLDVQVDYASIDGTAAAGADYTAALGSVTIPAGQLVATVVLSISTDNIHEGDESFQVQLSNPVHGSLGAQAVTDVTIADDDAMPEAGFALSSIDVSEDAGSVWVDVSLSRPCAQPVSVDFSFIGGTATPGTDFSSSGGTLTFAPGQQWQQVRIDVINDMEDEHDENFQVTLIAPVGCNLGVQAAMTVNILRDQADMNSISQGGDSSDAGGCASTTGSGFAWLALLGCIAACVRLVTPAARQES